MKTTALVSALIIAISATPCARAAGAAAPDLPHLIRDANAYRATVLRSVQIAEIALSNAAFSEIIDVLNTVAESQKVSGQVVRVSACVPQAKMAKRMAMALQNITLATMVEMLATSFDVKYHMTLTGVEFIDEAAMIDVYAKIVTRPAEGASEPLDFAESDSMPGANVLFSPKVSVFNGQRAAIRAASRLTPDFRGEPWLPSDDVECGISLDVVPRITSNEILICGRASITDPVLCATNEAFFAATSLIMPFAVTVPRPGASAYEARETPFQHTLPAADTTNISALIQQGRELVRTGQYEEALKAFSAVLKIDKYDVTARRYVTECRRALSPLNPDTTTKNQVASSGKGGQPSASPANASETNAGGRLASKGTSDTAGNLALLMQLGHSLYNDGRHEDALWAFSTVLRKEPGNTGAQRYVQECSNAIAKNSSSASKTGKASGSIAVQYVRIGPVPYTSNLVFELYLAAREGGSLRPSRH
ncbi:tetratricopeptide repeat protein [bacterium]|nr:tetratricopeptide repeat protein [bacterium]